jgi:hypothetical protein
MDVAKIPGLVSGAMSAPATTLAQQGSQSPANLLPVADQAHIRPLDVAGALQILLAEVRAAFALTADFGTSAPVLIDTPALAARQLIEMVLQSMPDDAQSVSAWAASLVRVESALQAGFDRALNAVTAWQDVPPLVIDAAKETRTLVFSALAEEPLKLQWLRPEWIGLAPRIERFWRRRRFVRRRLLDPDYSSANLDDTHEHQP